MTKGLGLGLGVVSD